MPDSNNIKTKYWAGRDIQFNKLASKVEAKIAMISGLSLLVLIIIATLWNPCPTETQFTVFRIIIAIALAGIASVLPGLFKLNYMGIIKIGSAAIIFFFAYLLEPGMVIIHDDCFQDNNIVKGTVLLNGHTLEDVHVTIPVQGASDNTNYSGKFFMQIGKVSSEEPLDMKLTYQDYEMAYSFMPEQGYNGLIIHFPDTAFQPSNSEIKKLVKQRIATFQEKLNAELSTELLKHNGAKSSLKEVAAAFTLYEKLDARQRNLYEFSNYDTTINFKKNILALGLQVDPVTPYHAYYFRRYDVYTLAHHAKMDQAKPNYTLQYIYVNRVAPHFKILKVKELDNGKCWVQIGYEQGLQYVQAQLNCSKATDHYKIRKMTYRGLQPVEAYLVYLEHGEWHLDFVGSD